MPWIINRTSPLDRTATPVFVKPHTSLRAALTDRWPGFTDFATPTLVTVDGVPRMRATWDSAISRTAVVECVALPAGVETMALISLAVTVASLLTTAYLIATMPSPVVPKGAIDIPPAAPVFTFAGQQNIRRLNQIIEKAYGRNRWWPAYLSAPYIEYANNKAIMRMWLSLGYGTFEIEDVMVNDTSLSQIPGAAWQYRDEGFAVTTDDPYDVVVYAKDISNTELAGTNEDDYAIIGPYVISQDSYVLASRININVAFPGGLFTVGDTITTSTVTYSAQLQLVDANNNPTGSVQTFSFSHSAAKTTPQRFTDSIEVTPGRYRISLYRTSLKDTTTSSQDRIVVESVCGLAHSMKTYPVSALRVELLGSDAIGNDAASKVNVRATAKVPTLVALPILGIGGITTTYAWTAPVATRNPIWCFLDVFRAQYGAAVPNDNLELAYYYALAEQFTNETFDFFFNNKATVWEAARVIAASFRGQPFIAGSDIRLTLDDPTNRPVAMFSPDNARNIEWTVSFAQQLDADCVDAAYVDSITGLQDTVRFTPPGSLGVNPEKISFDGVTDRTKAWQLAAYTHNVRTKRRQSVSFTTGLEGFIPLFGDLITVGWNLPSWGVAGVVNYYVNSTQIMEVSEPCDCNGTYAWLALRTSAGRPYGPIKVTQGVDLFHLHVETPITQYFDFTGETSTPVLFTFGVGQDYAKDIIVTRTSPSEDSVTVEGVLFAPEVFAYDSIDAPERGQDMLPFPVEAGAVPWIRVFEEDGAYLRVQWGVPQGSPTVTVEYAYNPTPGNPATLRYPGVFPLTTIVDVFTTSAYVPRQVGDLFIKVTTDDGVTVGTRWWYSHIGTFDVASTAYSLAATLTNNVDYNYVAPLDPLNAPDILAHGTTLGSYAAKWDVGTKELAVYVDTPPTQGATLRVTATRGAVSRSTEARLPQGGVFTFTSSALVAAGLNTVGTTAMHPSLVVSVTNDGEQELTFPVDIKDLTAGATPSCQVTFQSKEDPGVAGVLSTRFPGGGGSSVRLHGSVINFEVTPLDAPGAYTAEYTVLPVDGQVAITSAGVQATVRAVNGPFIASALFATGFSGTDYVNIQGLLVTAQTELPGSLTVNVDKQVLCYFVQRDTLRRVFPDTLFSIMLGKRTSPPRDDAPLSGYASVDLTLAANTQLSKNVFSWQVAHDLVMGVSGSERDNLMLILLEYPRTATALLANVSVQPLDILGKYGDASAYVGMYSP